MCDNAFVRFGWLGLAGMFVAVGAILLFFKLFIPTFYQDSGSPPICIALPFGIPAGLILGRIAEQFLKPKV